MKKLTQFALIAGAAACIAGSAQAGLQNVTWDITQDVSSTSHFKSILITLTGAFDGDILPNAFFQSIPTPTITNIDDGTPRAVESITFVTVGDNGETGVKFTFSDSSLFSPTEALRFQADADFEGSNEYLIGEDYAFSVPTPGVASLAGLGLFAASRRRRA